MSSHNPENSSAQTPATQSDEAKTAESEVTVTPDQEIHDIDGDEVIESQLNEEELASASEPFIGRWNRLVSTTNWEKGRIILQWRDALEDSGAAASEYSDDAWARRVGGLTGQHTGRLRRVYQRFATTFEKYEGLYWSHFQAAIDWNDAEMWLEGAVQNNWSVSNMRNERWEALGKVGESPKEEDVILMELNEDIDTDSRQAPESQGDEHFEESRPRPDGPDFGDEYDSSDSSSSVMRADDATDDGNVEHSQPFAEIGNLPDDVMEAFESFKLAIIRHRTDEWEQISCDDMLACLDSLKQLAVSPA